MEVSPVFEMDESFFALGVPFLDLHRLSFLGARNVS
jgi:hypothetical protein